VRCDERARPTLANLRLRQREHLARGWIGSTGSSRSAFEVQQRVQADLEEQPMAFLAGAQRVLRELAIRDVLEVHRQALGRRIRVHLSPHAERVQEHLEMRRVHP
jgi:hypothetical protein